MHARPGAIRFACSASLACVACLLAGCSSEPEATCEASVTGPMTSAAMTSAATTSGATTGAPTTSGATTDAPVGNVAPTAKITDDLTADRAAPLTLHFSSAGSSDPDGVIAQVAWAFGDGATAQGEQVEHVYAQEGSYTLTLTVTDDDGASASATTMYTVGGCPTFAPGKTAGKLESPALVEASGLAFSRRSPGVVWTHNDSEDAGRLYTFTSGGAALGVYTLQGVPVRDWEDMAIGPGPKAGQDYLYVGDIGDNNMKYPSIAVYRVAEPPVDARMTGVVASLGAVETLQLSYPEGASYNSETLLVDPVEGDLYLVTKSIDGVSRVFRAAAPLTSGVLEAVGQIELGPGGLTTGGSVSAAGDWVMVRTYFAAHMWHRPAGTPLHAALVGPGCEVPLMMEMQGEAISFAGEGMDYYSTSEGVRPPLYWYRRG